MGEQLVKQCQRRKKNGLQLYFNTKAAPFKDICEALEKLLLEKDGFFTDASYYLYPEDSFQLTGKREIIDEMIIQIQS